MRRLSSALALLAAVHGVAGAAAWTPVGPASVRTMLVATHPRDARHVYAGTQAGLFESRDRGTSWTAIGRGLPASEPCPVTSLAFDRRHRLLAGTGIRWMDGCGAYRSHTGRRWRPLALDVPRVIEVVPDPSRRGGLYLGSTGSGEGSTDVGNIYQRSGSASFRVALAGDDVDLDYPVIRVHPHLPMLVYAVSNNGGPVRSTDGGATWTTIDTGLPRSEYGGVFTYALALDPHNEDTLFVSVLGGGSCCILDLGPTAGVFVSYDHGDTWSAAGAGLEGLNVLALAADPIAAGVFYAGTTQGVYRSESFLARSWSPLGEGLTDAVLSLAIDVEGHELYAGTLDRGVFRLAVR